MLYLLIPSCLIDRITVTLPVLELLISVLVLVLALTLERTPPPLPLLKQLLVLTIMLEHKRQLVTTVNEC